MAHVRVDAGVDEPFSYKNLQELVKACTQYFHTSIENATDAPEVRKRRAQLSSWIHKFHQASGTSTPCVEEAIEKLRKDSCLLLMTAHQPNLFPYSGVLRKATLNHILAQELSERLSLPVISFFGIADQDFTDDRWVKSALLPDVERRDGVLELRMSLPEKIMLNRVSKPSRQVLDSWREEIRTWFSQKLASIERFSKSCGFEFSSRNTGLEENFEDFWKVVEESYEKAQTYSDFNAFLISRITNVAWGYGTLFARFSECQQIFEPEFRFLLSHFEEYSQYVGEATLSVNSQGGGIYEQECDTVPFWYHCGCGSKVRLMAEHRGDSFTAHGECLRCGKRHTIDFSSEKEPKISDILSRISARSLPMPLVFFDGLKVCCYVGGVGGKEYLRQARYVAEHMGLTFPPVVLWRPKDIYHGAGQLEALLTFARLSGTFDFSQCPALETQLKEKIASILKDIDELESQKKELANNTEAKKEDIIEKKKALSARQNEIRKETDFSVLSRNLILLSNIVAVMSLYPCIVDYAVNIGLRATSDQWIAFLKEEGSLSSDVNLKTAFDTLVQRIQSKVSD